MELDIEGFIRSRILGVWSVLDSRPGRADP